MAVLSDLLISFVKPAVSRVFLALGISVVTVAGVDTSIDWFKTSLKNSFLFIDPVILSLMGVAGAWEALSIIFGGVAFAVSYWTLTRSVRFLGV